MSSDEETAMIRETVAKFVDRELIPLELDYLKSKLPGSYPELQRAEATVAQGLEGARICGASMPPKTGRPGSADRYVAAVQRNRPHVRVSRCHRTRPTCACCRRRAPRRKSRNT